MARSSRSNKGTFEKKTPEASAPEQPQAAPESTTEPQAAPEAAPEPEESVMTPPAPEPPADSQLTPPESQIEDPKAAAAAEQPVVRVKPVKDPNAKQTVTPKRTIPKVRIGGEWHSFQKGKAVKVPVRIVQHLELKGVI